MYDMYNIYNKSAIIDWNNSKKFFDKIFPSKF